MSLLVIATIGYRIKERNRFKTILNILGQKRDPIPDVEYAKLHVAYGRKELALLLLRNALREDPAREDIRKAIRVIESW